MCSVNLCVGTAAINTTQIAGHFRQIADSVRLQMSKKPTCLTFSYRSLSIRIDPKIALEAIQLRDDL